MDRRGKYIVIEGPDGTGKTTHAKLLVETLNHHGMPSRYVHEPGGTPIGRELERIIKDRTLDRSPDANLLLFTADRLETYRNVIRPALANGESIVADRNWISSVAYQGTAGGLGIERVQQETMAWLPPEYTYPTFTILLFIDDEQRRSMLAGRGTSSQDYFESKSDTFHQRINKGYEMTARTLGPDRGAHISASGSITNVHTRILETLQSAGIISWTY